MPEKNEKENTSLPSPNVISESTLQDNCDIPSQSAFSNTSVKNREEEYTTELSCDSICYKASQLLPDTSLEPTQEETCDDFLHDDECHANSQTIIPSTINCSNEKNENKRSNKDDTELPSWLAPSEDKEIHGLSLPDKTGLTQGTTSAKNFVTPQTTLPNTSVNQTKDEEVTETVNCYTPHHTEKSEKGRSVPVQVSSFKNQESGRISQSANKYVPSQTKLHQISIENTNIDEIEETLLDGNGYIPSQIALVKKQKSGRSNQSENSYVPSQAKLCKIPQDNGKVDEIEDTWLDNNGYVPSQITLPKKQDSGSSRRLSNSSNSLGSKINSPITESKKKESKKELPCWLQAKCDKETPSPDSTKSSAKGSEPNMKKRSSQELPCWLQPTVKPAEPEDLDKTDNVMNDTKANATTSRRNKPFIKKELPEWLQPIPKSTKPAEKKIEDEEPLFEELRIPKRSNTTANGRPSRRTLSAAEVFANAQQLDRFDNMDTNRRSMFPKVTSHAKEDLSTTTPSEAENLIKKVYERSWSSDEEDLINRCLNRTPKKKKGKKTNN